MRGPRRPRRCGSRLNRQAQSDPGRLGRGGAIRPVRHRLVRRCPRRHRRLLRRHRGRRERRRLPTGPPTRRTATQGSPHHPAADGVGRAIARARQRAENRARAEVRRRLAALVAGSGFTAGSLPGEPPALGDDCAVGGRIPDGDLGGDAVRTVLALGTVDSPRWVAPGA